MLIGVVCVFNNIPGVVNVDNNLNEHINNLENTLQELHHGDIALFEMFLMFL